VKKMSEPMYEKFEKYWGEIELLMSIAFILDPRFKLVSLYWTFERLYPKDELHDRVVEVTNKLKSLFAKYSQVRMATRAVASSSSNTTIVEPNEDDFYAYLKTIGVGQPVKSDPEVYLEGVFMVDDSGLFNVLRWWSQNCTKFPILSKLARDVLCIPITTVASESTFSAGDRVLDDYRSSVMKDMVEILVCGGDWIKAASKTTIQTLQVRFSF
jgi:hAT family C-terminal dimerisation region/Domain of unknown function (DUF4413)